MIQSLGQYKVLEQIGAGGLGDVYRARDTRHGRTVTIKVLPESIARHPERRAQFLEDARAAAALSHPNIVTLHEVGEEAERLFLVFDFVPGETLTAAIAGRALNPRRAVDLAVQLADGLAEAHAAGIVHRDLRPDNVIVTPKGAAKILDVGLASWTGGDHPVRSGHLSPEQSRGEAPDDRSDTFSLGAILFEMLTGAAPEGDDAAPAGVAPQIAAVVRKSLASNPERRYQSAVTLAADLRSVALALDAQTEAAGRAPAPVRTRAARGSSTGWIVALFAAALAAAAWMYYGR